VAGGVYDHGEMILRLTKTVEFYMTLQKMIGFKRTSFLAKKMMIVKVGAVHGKADFTVFQNSRLERIVRLTQIV